MRGAIIVGTVAAFVASPVTAQITTCSRTVNYVNCYTMQPPPNITPPPAVAPPPPQMDFSGFAALFVAMREKAKRKREEKEAERVRAMDEAARPGVIERLRAGDCRGAIDHAVSRGSLSFAGEVASYCQTIEPARPD